MLNLIKRYGLTGSLYMLYCLVLTKLSFSKAKIIRRPIDIRGKSRMKIGKGFVTGKYCRLETHDHSGIDHGEYKLSIGERVEMNDFCHITAANKVIIGDDVLIASKVYISDVSHGVYGKNDQHSDVMVPPAKRPLIAEQVLIGDRVWLGDGVCVLPGVSIGEGAIIGANSVVTKDIPPNTIAVGIPARPVKVFDLESKVWKRLKS